MEKTAFIAKQSRKCKNDNDNCIHFKNSSGSEEWLKFNLYNELIYYKDSTGLEKWYEYDNYTIIN